MRILIWTVSVVVLFTSHASAQTKSEKIELICNNPKNDSSIIVKIGDARDGFPIESYNIDGVEKSEIIVQYVFQLNDGNISNQIITVQRDEEGRIHKHASIRMADEGMIMESIEFNVDAKKPEDTVIQS